MKALIGSAVAVLGLGGVLVANSGRSSSAVASPQAGPAVVSAERAGTTTGPALVDCGEGRQAVIHPSNAANGLSKVECVALGAMPAGYGQPVFASQFAQPAVLAQPVATPAREVVHERVVYRDRPVARTSARRASASGATTSAPTYRTEPRQTRSWKKSAVIIGGSTAAGAGVGAVLGGKSGAKKGAVVGLVGGTVYDIATRNK